MKGATRKITFAILFGVFVSLVVFAAGCGGPNYSLADKPTVENYSADNMKSELEAFVNECPDRSALTKTESPESGNGESKAAEYIAERIKTLTGLTAQRTVFEHNINEDVFESSNVILPLKAPEANNPNKYKVIFGAHYDNTYTDSPMGGKYRGYKYYTGTKAEGALSNGAAVAVMLRMCEYFSGITDELNVDVDFVFYGMGCVDYYGAQHYYDSLGETGRSKILLSVTLDNIGADNLYMYFDECPTSHGKFIMGVADYLGYSDYVSEPPVAQADLPVQTVKSLPYTPYELINESSVYFDNENVCVITSGSDNTFLLYRQDGSGKPNISGTVSDDLGTLSSVYPDYSYQMSVAADVITRAVNENGFTGACGEGLEASYGFWTSTLAAYIACAVLGAALFGASIAIVVRLRKKYVEPDLRRNIKVAVFGMDYEQPSDGDIFFDIHTGDDPFSDAFDKNAGESDNENNGGSEEDKHDDE